MLKVILKNQAEFEDFLNRYHTMLLDILHYGTAEPEDLEPLKFSEVMDFLESNSLILQNGERVHIHIEIESVNVNQILIFEKMEDLSEEDKVYVRFFLQKL
ncbi:hypothetical protein ACSMFR_02285 [Listeria aquatica]|uniref:hypothetical protein n=1 Tax=Listeria aquatica TaxID=1494960 RepID=UPI003F72F025